MNNRLSITSRILVAFASGALVVVFFLPVWRIDLFAPQYPEGLTMNIWINGLSGDVDVINGLNHYIGMKHITVAMFPEFKFLPYVVAFFLLLGMTIAVTGDRRGLFIYLVLTAIGGILAMYDFYQWGYDYGHNLDPKAPIQVPGFSYQPPVIGHKRLLNFDAYSFPGVGGWVVIAAGSLVFVIWFVEWYRYRNRHHKSSFSVVAVFLLPPLLFISCTTKPEPFQQGKDLCSFCRMGISDMRYGGELVTKKGRIYKFDDLHCMVTFLRSGSVEEKAIAQSLVINFQKPNTFIEAGKASFVVGPGLKSPMGGNAAGFETKEAAISFAKEKGAEMLGWQLLPNKLK
jgi:copper chaperone NosL